MAKHTSLDQIEQHIIDVTISLRHKHNLRQCDLGKIINTSPSFIGNVENYNNPAKYNLKHINALAEYFNLAPKYFMPEKPLSAK
jgi:transcriptional regulator with XRE-family HTH domain